MNKTMSLISRKVLVCHASKEMGLTGSDLVAPNSSLHELSGEHLGHLERRGLAGGIGELSARSAFHHTRDRGGVDNLPERRPKAEG